MSDKKRVLIIGMDGFTWKLGADFMKEGIMPNLASLVEKGASGDLVSVVPYETSPAWTSFQTGCLPGKTGIYGFHNFNRRDSSVKLNNFSRIRVPTLWEIIARANKTCVSINMPLTHPAPQVKGAIIPGMLCPVINDKTVMPGDVYDKYIKPVEGYDIVNMNNTATLDDFIAAQLAVERAREKVALRMIQDIDWDIFSVQIQSTDHVQHDQWYALDREYEGFDDSARKKVIEIYRYCDEFLGRIVEHAEEKTLIMVVSDHGFCKADAAFRLNIWLRKKGYLKLQNRPVEQNPSKKGIKEWVKTNIPGARQIAIKIGSMLKPQSRVITPSQAIEKLYCEKDLEKLRDIVDIERSTALALGCLGSLIYIKGTQAEREETAQRISDGLLKDFGPGSKQEVIESVTLAWKFYGFEKPAEEMPDLVVKIKEGYYATSTSVGDNEVKPMSYTTPYYKNKKRGTHSQNGVFVVKGPGVKTGHRTEAHITDITPTVLSYLGLAVPDHADGKVISEIFDQPLPQRTEPMSIDRKEQYELAEDQQAELEQHLADLGYI